MAPRDLLDNSVRYAQRTVAALMICLTLLCFAQSYRQLIDFATEHQIAAPWRYTWPAMLDGFTVLGELLLFVTVVLRWKRRALVLGAAVAAAGFAASLAANVWYLPRADAAVRATAAVAPVGAAAALCIGLVMLEFTVRDAVRAEEMLRAAGEPMLCPLCSEELPVDWRELEFDHVIPKKYGGPDEEWNLQIVHKLCNSTKNDALTPAALLLAEEHGIVLQTAAPPLSLVRAAPRALRWGGPEVQQAREECRNRLAAGQPLPSARGLAARHLGGDGRTGGNARMAKRILEEFEGDVAAAAHSG